VLIVSLESLADASSEYSSLSLPSSWRIYKVLPSQLEASWEQCVLRYSSGEATLLPHTWCTTWDTCGTTGDGWSMRAERNDPTAESVLQFSFGGTVLGSLDKCTGTCYLSMACWEAALTMRLKLCRLCFLVAFL
jgi:hypothetical protein